MSVLLSWVLPGGGFKPANWDLAAQWQITNVSSYQNQLTALCDAFKTKFKSVKNMTTVNACVRKAGETFDDYIPRKLQVFNAHGND